jgi:hypothetical protein
MSQAGVHVPTLAIIHPLSRPPHLPHLTSASTILAASSALHSLSTSLSRPLRAASSRAACWRRDRSSESSCRAPSSR